MPKTQELFYLPPEGELPSEESNTAETAEVISREVTRADQLETERFAKDYDYSLEVEEEEQGPRAEWTGGLDTATGGLEKKSSTKSPVDSRQEVQQEIDLSLTAPLAEKPVTAESTTPVEEVTREETPPTEVDAAKHKETKLNETLPDEVKGRPSAAQIAWSEQGKAAAPGSLSLKNSLDKLAELIANVTEAYTVAIFLAEPSTKMLRVEGVHTLSRDFLGDTRIGFGHGLVGWTAENAVRISVCPFEHNATTLLYYASDQDLKSFIAVPIIDRHGELAGVICCDSKKSYAFAKLAEKILLDCAVQAASMIELFSSMEVNGRRDRHDAGALQKCLEELRTHDDEDSLLFTAAKTPANLVQRDALVVMTTAQGGVGSGAFYSTSAEEHVEHRLLELVCKHKKVICGDRSVHALPVDDIKNRSFLSIPFHVMDREAGSLNLLSKPNEVFSSEEISALERIAAVVGRELERIRLRGRVISKTSGSAVPTWHEFSGKGGTLLKHGQQQKVPLCLLRVLFSNLHEVEEYFGVDVATAVSARLGRLVDQISREPALSCSLYGEEALILCEASEGDRLLTRLQRLVARLNVQDFSKLDFSTSKKLGEMLASGMVVAAATSDQLGYDLESLAAGARQLLDERRALSLSAHGRLAGDLSVSHEDEELKFSRQA